MFGACGVQPPRYENKSCSLTDSSYTALIFTCGVSSCRGSLEVTNPTRTPCPSLLSWYSRTNTRQRALLTRRGKHEHKALTCHAEVRVAVHDLLSHCQRCLKVGHYRIHVDMRSSPEAAVKSVVRQHKQSREKEPLGGTQMYTNSIRACVDSLPRHPRAPQDTRIQSQEDKRMAKKSTNGYTTTGNGSFYVAMNAWAAQMLVPCVYGCV